MRCMSMGFFVDDDQPVIWRGPMLHKALEQFLVDVDWGDPEFLLIDMPPGTGDVALSMAQYLPTSEVYVVTTPQPAARRVAQRSAYMAKKINLPLRGVIENMSWFTGAGRTRQPLFGEGGGAQLADELGVPLLGQIPLDPALREGGDEGRPIAVRDPDSEAAQAFAAIGRARGRAGPGPGLSPGADDPLRLRPDPRRRPASRLRGASRHQIRLPDVGRLPEHPRVDRILGGRAGGGERRARRSAAGWCSACSVSGAVGIVAGRQIQRRPGRPCCARSSGLDPTGLSRPAARATTSGIYTVTDGYPNESDSAYRLTVDGLVDSPLTLPWPTCRRMPADPAGARLPVRDRLAGAEGALAGGPAVGAAGPGRRHSRRPGPCASSPSTGSTPRA